MCPFTARLHEALRSVAPALKENGPRFALAGSYALWAHGARERQGCRSAACRRSGGPSKAITGDT